VNSLVVQRHDADIVLNDATVEGFVPVLGEVIAALQERAERFEFLLVRHGVIDDFFLEEELNGVSERERRME